MGADAKQVNGVHHFTLNLGGAETGLLFAQASLPGGSLDVQSFKTMAANGNPVNSCGGGTQVQWSDLVLVRGVDDDHQLWEWFKAVAEKGACAENKKDITITCMDSEGQTMHTWNVTGACIVNYNMTGLDAQTAAILTESVSIRYEDATLE